MQAAEFLALRQHLPLEGYDIMKEMQDKPWLQQPPLSCPSSSELLLHKETLLSFVWGPAEDAGQQDNAQCHKSPAVSQQMHPQ